MSVPVWGLSCTTQAASFTAEIERKTVAAREKAAGSAKAAAAARVAWEAAAAEVEVRAAAHEAAELALEEARPALADRRLAAEEYSLELEESIEVAASAARGQAVSAVEWPGGLLLALCQNHAPPPAFEEARRAALRQHQQQQHSEAIATLGAALARFRPVPPLAEAEALTLRASCYRVLGCHADSADDTTRARERRRAADDAAKELAPQILSVVPEALLGRRLLGGGGGGDNDDDGDDGSAASGGLDEWDVEEADPIVLAYVAVAVSHVFAGLCRDAGYPDSGLVAALRRVLAPALASAHDRRPRDWVAMGDGESYGTAFALCFHCLSKTVPFLQGGGPGTCMPAGAPAGRSPRPSRPGAVCSAR
eukprot:SAG22_NODE_317_length_12513_cov_41.467214_8_plen_366_part_00